MQHQVRRSQRHSPLDLSANVDGRSNIILKNQPEFLPYTSWPRHDMLFLSMLYLCTSKSYQTYILLPEEDAIGLIWTMLLHTSPILLFNDRGSPWPTSILGVVAVSTIMKGSFKCLLEENIVTQRAKALHVSFVLLFLLSFYITAAPTSATIYPPKRNDVEAHSRIRPVHPTFLRLSVFTRNHPRYWVKEADETGGVTTQ
jgi:hypothetical protein